TIVLSSRSSAVSVFSGAMVAFFIVDGLSALLGGELLRLLPRNIIGLATGLIFILFGLIPLLRKEEETAFNKTETSFFKTFSLVSLMELGDKTQMASILLAAQFRNPLMVLIGVMLAFSLITGIGVLLGSKILKFVGDKYLKIATSTIFIVFGFILIFDALSA
ncbi:TMEM165/GDT1 family protein, partial [Candidatus Bathyarchaeota archaeon]|nr:TMEM165/GDT1 family protein [Candidatus Bathyarchaeota archaeon]